MNISHRLHDRYEIIRELGDGGFGQTFLGRDCQMPSLRACVIKQLKPVSDNAEVYEIVKNRFQREAAILERLGGHEQIPHLYAHFSESDKFYLVEEYIAGQTLTQKIQQEGPQAEAIVRSMLVNLLPVLVYVHQQQIVHRDVKPDNIILRTSDQKPVLIDFGAVKETMRTILNSQEDSMSIVVGTPGYMPPEQMSGRPIFVSDLYSLGLTAIYMLTGKTPQELDSNPATGEIVWRSFVPNISASFATFLDRAIQLNAQTRFNSAQEMLTALIHLDVPFQPAQNVTSAPPQGECYSNVETFAAMPRMPRQQAYSQPYTVAPPSKPKETWGWLKAVLTGGIIGVSLLTGLVSLKGSQGAANNSVASVAPSPLSVPAKSLSEKPPEKPTTASSPEPTAPPKVNPQEVAESNADTNSTVIGDEGEKNIRSGPGTKYSVLSSASTGDRLKVLASSRDVGNYIWHKVYYPKSKVEGWVAAHLIRVDEGTEAAASLDKLARSSGAAGEQKTTESNATDQATVDRIAERNKRAAYMQAEAAPSTKNEGAKTQIVEANYSDNIEGTVTGTTGNKHIRSGAGTEHSILFDLHTGDRVSVQSTMQDSGGYTWYRIYSPQTGQTGWIAGQLLKLH